MKKFNILNLTVLTLLSLFFEAFSAQQDDDLALALALSLSLSDQDQKIAHSKPTAKHKTSSSKLPKKEEGFDLDSYDFQGAGVLPLLEGEAVLLGRETNKGIYSSFGGSRDKNETSIQTAAREFNEESKQMFFKNNKDAIEYINKNTEQIIVRNGAVIYLTKFDFSNENMSNFYSSQLKGHKYMEMDKLAIVPLKFFPDVIQKSVRGRDLEVQALVIEAKKDKNGKTIYTNKEERIKIRPFLGNLLRPYYQGKPSVKGKDPRVLFYNS